MKENTNILKEIYTKKIEEGQDSDTLLDFKNIEINKIPFLINYYIGDDVPLLEEKAYFYPNLDVYVIKIKTRDVIADETLTKKLVYSIDGEELEKKII